MKKVLLLAFCLLVPQARADELENMQKAAIAVGNDITTYSLGCASMSSTIKTIQETQMPEYFPLMDGDAINSAYGYFDTAYSCTNTASAFVAYADSYQSWAVWAMDSWSDAETEEDKGWYSEAFWGYNYMANEALGNAYTAQVDFDYATNSIWDIFDEYDE